MSKTNHLDVNKKQDFVMLFDVVDGNPNGDPDAGNMPRFDPETMHGIVTDVCIKRKVRDYVDLKFGEDSRYKIYVQSGTALNSQNERAYTATKTKSTGTKQALKDVNVVRDWMCENFYDIRTFGAVMTTKVNCGQVRGPVQMTFGRSIDPIVPMDVTITRVAVTRKEDLVSSSEENGETTGKVSEMGRKYIVPYGLYRVSGFFNPSLAKQTGFDNNDLELLWESLLKMWEFDRSASRGMMSCRGLYIFSHDEPIGNHPCSDLFDRIQCSPKPNIVPRSFSDYNVSTPLDSDLENNGMPTGVSFTMYSNKSEPLAA